MSVFAGGLRNTSFVKAKRLTKGRAGDTLGGALGFLQGLRKSESQGASHMSLTPHRSHKSYPCPRASSALCIVLGASYIVHSEHRCESGFPWTTPTSSRSLSLPADVLPLFFTIFC